MRSTDLSVKLQADTKKLLLVRARFHRYVQESRCEYEQVMNTARTRNPRNRSMLRGTEGLPESRKTRKATAVLWCVQVDAAAQDDAEVNGGGGAPRLATRGRRRERDEGEKRK